MSTPTEPRPDVFDAGGRGLQNRGLRRANERAVLTVIGLNRGVSNADIARMSGLAPQTVSAILADIEQAGLITRGDVLRGRRGQPATPISLRANGAYALGAEIGWRHVDVILLNLHAEVLVHERRTYDYPDARSIVTDIVGMTETIVATLPEEARARLTDMGLTLPTNIALSLDLVDAPVEQAALWSALDLVAELSSRTKLEISLFNDGNAACWAELIAFPTPRPASFIYLMISRYVAAGIVGEGILWEGPNGNWANLGSMLVADVEGRLDAAQFIASTAALARRLKAAGIPLDDTAVENWQWDSFGLVLEQWLADSARALAMVIFNTVTVIESGVVVIDGIIPAAIIERLVQGVAAELEKLPSIPQRPRIMAGHLGALAPSIGAAELPLYRRFFSRTIADLVG